jgi:hypothetical protein
MHYSCKYFFIRELLISASHTKMCYSYNDNEVKKTHLKNSAKLTVKKVDGCRKMIYIIPP